MSRHKFGGMVADWAFSFNSDGSVSQAGGAVLTFWDSLSGGTQYTAAPLPGGVDDGTGLLDGTGTPVSAVTCDGNGEIPDALQGPDGVYRMAADASGAGTGPRRWLYANDIGNDLTTLLAEVAGLPAAGQAPAYAYYDSTLATYPARPAVTAPVWWVGPVAPPVGGTGASGSDVWLNTTGGTALGGVTSVTAGDGSVTIGGTAAAPTVETSSLDVIAGLHPAAADWSNNRQKITGLAPGIASTDAATVGQVGTGGGAGGLIPTSVQTSAYTASVSDFVLVSTASANVTVTLPSAPADGSRIGVKMVAQASSRTVTIAAGGSDLFNVAGGSASVTLTGLFQAVTVQYQATAGLWLVTGADPGKGTAGLGWTPLTGVAGAWQDIAGRIIVLPKSASGGSGDDGPLITAAAAAASGAGASAAYMGGAGQTSGLVILSPNLVYDIRSTITLPPGCELHMSRGTILAFSGTGPCLQAQGNEAGSWNIQGMGSRIIGGTIDGTAVSPTAIAGGIEVGGQFDITLQDVTVQNFTSGGTDGYTGHNPLGAYGISIDNRNTMSEKVIIRNCTVNNCGTPNLTTTPPSQAGGAALQFVHTGATSGSHMYPEVDLHINQQPGQNGLVIGKDGQPYYGSFKMRGNMTCPATGNNGCAAIVVGVGTGAGQQGHFSASTFDVNIESDQSGGSSTQPYTVYFGANADNLIGGSFGFLRFGDSFRNSNAVVGGTAPQMQFSGHIVGDGAGLAAVGPPAAAPVLGTTYTNNGNDAVVYINGGTVTGISVKGTATGRTAGAFPLPMNATIQVNGTAAPSWAWVSNVSTS